MNSNNSAAVSYSQISSHARSNTRRQGKRWRSGKDYVFFQWIPRVDCQTYPQAETPNAVFVQPSGISEKTPGKYWIMGDQSKREVCVGNTTNVTPCELEADVFQVKTSDVLIMLDRAEGENVLEIIGCGKPDSVEQSQSCSFFSSSSDFSNDCTSQPDVGATKSFNLVERCDSAKYQPVVKLTRLSQKDLGRYNISTLGGVDIEYPKMVRGLQNSRHACKFCTHRSKGPKDRLKDSAIVREPHGCTICGRTFRFQCELQFHAVTHKLEIYSCTFCGEKYRCRRKVRLLEHFRTHSGERPFSCVVCNKTFRSHSGIKSHWLTHSGEKGFACAVCQKRFARAQEVKSHLLTHSGEKPHVCTVCSQQFPRLQQLKSHMRVHTGGKPYSCKYCQKTFAHHLSWKCHLVTHTGERPFACTLCPKTCTQASHLRSHMATHFGERRYACSLCDKRFTQSSHLKTHMLTHAGEKPHRCEVCQRCFANSSTHRIHTRMTTGEKRYSCSLCTATFKQQNALKSHLNRAHTREKPHSCKVCQKHFRQPCDLRYHMTSHTDDKPWQCLLCDKRFSSNRTLKYHMMYHTGEKPFVCQICNKGFKNKGSLRKHLVSRQVRQRHCW